MVDVPGSVVTPEAVRLDYVVGGIATRTFAKIIDIIVLIVVWIGLAFMATQLTEWLVGRGTLGLGTGESVRRVAQALISLFVVVFAVPLCETRWNGRTPGKAVLGLRVVTDIGETIGLSQSMIRGLVQLVEIPTGIGLVVALSNPRNQRLGDLSAATFVIHDRGKLVASTLQPTIFPPPPGCWEIVAGLDVSRLTSREFVFIRDYLLRAPEFTPDARIEVGDQLVALLVPKVRGTPPFEMPPDLFLNCVASAYQGPEAWGGPRQELLRSPFPETPFGSPIRQGPLFAVSESAPPGSVQFDSRTGW